MWIVRLYGEHPVTGDGGALLEEAEFRSEEDARRLARDCASDGWERITVINPRYGRTVDEQERHDACHPSLRMELARQIDAERAERAAQARQAELDAQHADWMVWVRWTQEKAAAEARKHRAGLPCEPHYCHECAAEINRAAGA